MRGSVSTHNLRINPIVQKGMSLQTKIRLQHLVFSNFKCKYTFVNVMCVAPTSEESSLSNECANAEKYIFSMMSHVFSLFRIPCNLLS